MFHRICYCDLFFFLIHLKKFLVGEELLYNVVLVSAIQQQ